MVIPISGLLMRTVGRGYWKRNGSDGAFRHSPLTLKTILSSRGPPTSTLTSTNGKLLEVLIPALPIGARELGYPEFEIVGAKKDDRFEEIPDQPASCDRCLTRNLACLKDTSPETKTIGCIPCGKSRVRCSLNDAVVTRKRKAPEPENTSSGSSKRLKSNDGRRRSTRAKK
ncbi:hypothetical protein MPER_08414 [Moniliophthora perniciosa FA553]|nr:hypothetical protein MPER_08414 [Moniliophthora perniciosa FA553]